MPKPKKLLGYTPKRIFFETLIGYQEASRTKPIDTYFKGDNKQ